MLYCLNCSKFYVTPSIILIKLSFVPISFYIHSIFTWYDNFIRPINILGKLPTNFINRINLVYYFLTVIFLLICFRCLSTLRLFIITFYVLHPAVKLPRKHILTCFRKRRKKRKKINWSMLRFFRYVGRNISAMILSFITYFSLRTKNTYVSRIFILIPSLKSLQLFHKNTWSLFREFFNTYNPPSPKLIDSFSF